MYSVLIFFDISKLMFDPDCLHSRIFSEGLRAKENFRYYPIIDCVCPKNPCSMHVKRDREQGIGLLEPSTLESTCARCESRETQIRT